ncbi:MAG TPA: antA/AntB antirepressor family protein [Candidatus Competibacter sp.]|nr:antA/AntB antirepressor family protein [Candidatus Competibacter sp.]
MTTALVPVVSATIGARSVQAVNARDLHVFMEVGRDFSTWIKDRIEEYGFVEEEDFSPVLGKSTGGRPAYDYLLTLDTAKELAMVERNAKGREVRRYFIECEQKWQSVAAVAGKRDVLLETCIKEAGRGNVFAMTALMTWYGFPSDLSQRQMDHMAAMRGQRQRKLDLPATRD